MNFAVGDPVDRSVVAGRQDHGDPHGRGRLEGQLDVIHDLGGEGHRIGVFELREPPTDRDTDGLFTVS